MSIDTFANFDLLILREGARYQAHVVASPVGEAETQFDLPFTVAELRAFTWLSGRATRQLRLTGSTPEPPLGVREFGSRLYAACFGGAVGQCLVRSLDKTRQDGQGLRIRLRLNSVPELADLPWEYLYAAGPHAGFLALSAASPIVRYPELPQSTTPLHVQPPLGILAVVADPQDVPKLDVEREWRLLSAALAPLQSRQLLRLERLEQPTIGALQRRLGQAGSDVHVLHFIGHGAYDEERAAGGLYLEDEERNHRFVVADDLAVLLHDHAALRFVFLNACEGARSSDTGSLCRRCADAAAARHPGRAGHAVPRERRRGHGACPRLLPGPGRRPARGRGRGGGAQGHQGCGQRPGVGHARALQPLGRQPAARAAPG